MWMKSGEGWDIAKSSLVDKTFLKCIHICYQVPLMCIVQDTSKSSGSKTWREKTHLHKVSLCVCTFHSHEKSKPFWYIYTKNHLAGKTACVSRCSPDLVHFSSSILHLSQHFPQTVAHEVRPFRTAIITFQVLQDAQEECVHSHAVD